MINGDLTLGQFALFNTLLLQLAWPLEALGWIVNLGQRAIASAGRSFAWLDGIGSLPEPATPRALPDGPLSVRLEGVDFAYATEHDVLRETSTSSSPPARSWPSAAAPARASRACSVSSRASTTRSSGSVEIGGVDLRDLALVDLRAAVAVGTQRPGAVLGAAARQPARRPRRRAVGRGARGLRGRRRRRVPRPAAGRLRHADRRARRQPVGRPAPARGARARADLGCARARARRPALGRRHAHRGKRARAPARRPPSAAPCSSPRNGSRPSRPPIASSCSSTARIAEEGTTASARAARAARSTRSSETRPSLSEFGNLHRRRGGLSRLPALRAGPAACVADPALARRGAAPPARPVGGWLVLRRRDRQRHERPRRDAAAGSTSRIYVGVNAVAWCSGATRPTASRARPAHRARRPRAPLLAPHRACRSATSRSSARAGSSRA